MAQEKSKAGGGKASKFARRLEGGTGAPPPAEARASEAPEPALVREKTVRVTVDLPRGQHRFLRILAAESGSDGMRVMRALLDEVSEDEGLAERIRRRLAVE